MDGGQIGLIVALLVLLVFSAFFSAMEMAYSCISKVRLKTMEQDGNKRAGAVLKALENYDRVLSTILVGNNVVNITAASLATVLFTSFFVTNPSMGATVATIVMTAVVLIFGEVTPKSIAKENPEKFVITFHPIMKFFIYFLIPFNAFFMLWKKMLNKIFKFKKMAAITEDELITYVEVAENEGGIDCHESKLIRSAIEFDDLDISDIMIPRVNVIAAEENTDIEIIADLFREHGFSRLPIFTGTIDSVIGILHEKDFYSLYRNKINSVKEVVQTGLCVSKSMKLSTVLRMLQKGKVHMAIVVDEFGGTEGIVTLEDILEELVGEIWDEHDEEEELMRKMSEGTYVVAGSYKIEDLFELTDVDTKEDYDATTVGGFVTEMIGKIPQVGEKFAFEALEFTVTKASASRVLEVKVVVLKDDYTENNPEAAD